VIKNYYFSCSFYGCFFKNYSNYYHKLTNILGSNSIKISIQIIGGKPMSTETLGTKKNVYEVWAMGRKTGLEPATLRSTILSLTGQFHPVLPDTLAGSQQFYDSLKKFLWLFHGCFFLKVPKFNLQNSLFSTTFRGEKI
jgi:hypothetical protein